MDIATEEEKVLEIDSILPAQQTDSTLFYYYQGDKIPLTERKDLIAVQFIDIGSKNNFLSGLSNISNLKEWNENNSSLKNNSQNILILQLENGGITKEIFEEWQKREDVYYLSYPFDKDGQVFVMLNEFSVKVKKSTDEQEVRKLASQYDCEVFQRPVFDSDIYFVRCTKWSEMGTIRIANAFYETDLFEFAAPDFFFPDCLLSSDPYYSVQWGLKNIGQYGTSGIDINIENAWAVTEGSEDVVVAVVDSGVELNHTDLSSNLVNGHDAAFNLTGGGPADNNDHGTNVAGIIAAVKNNNIGISGVAPDCKIMPILVSGTTTSLAAGIKWAQEHGADVINCSWGFSPPSGLITSEINSAATLGRNGKGCILVFAAGNNGAAVEYPANLSNVISVGAFSYDGKRKTPSSPDGNNWESNYGLGLNLLAPGVNIKTLGMSNSYAERNGTSFAAPHVAGVAALILSKYPNLTREQVTKAILYSCTTPSGYTYTYSYDYPYTSMYNNEVGHGRLNAGNALLLAYQLDYQDYVDATSGIDVTINNNSSYPIEMIGLEIFGVVGGNTILLYYGSMGDVASWHEIGYPVFRGQDLSSLTPGTTISNIQLNMYASCPYASPNGVRIAVQMDNPVPSNYQVFSFGDWNCYQRTIPNSSVPDGYRRRLYIRIINN